MAGPKGDIGPKLVIITVWDFPLKCPLTIETRKARAMVDNIVLCIFDLAGVFIKRTSTAVRLQT